MHVFFLRHAEAEDISTSDFDRKLTAKGLEQADKVGKFCARNGLVPDVILSSPLVRAEQTARSAAKRLGDPEVIVERWLACGMTDRVCFEQLGAYTKFDSVMLVGHEPDFSGAISSMIGVPDSDAVVVRKASLTLIDLRGFRTGGGHLQFSIPVRLM